MNQAEFDKQQTWKTGTHPVDIGIYTTLWLQLISSIRTSFVCKGVTISAILFPLYQIPALAIICRTLTGQLTCRKTSNRCRNQQLQLQLQSSHNSPCDLLLLHQGLDFILHLTQLEVDFPLLDTQLTQVLPHVLCIPCSHLLTATSCVQHYAC